MNARHDEYDGSLDDLFGDDRADHESTAVIDVGAPAAAQGRGGMAENTTPTRSSETAPTPSTAPPPRGRGSRNRNLVLGLAALAVVLVVGAFGVGRLFAEEGGVAAGTSAADADGSASGGSGGSAGEDAAPYEGAVDAVQVAGSSASCQSPNSVDAAGNATTYPPSNAHDADLSTAWRCNGNGRGQRLTLTLPDTTRVAEVGLVPGYAKTDPANGVDRYAENNRITRVRWHFDDGTTVVQRMSGAPGDRSMRTVRVPPAETRTVELEVLDSVRGPRNTIAVSEVRVAEVAGG